MATSSPNDGMYNDELMEEEEDTAEEAEAEEREGEEKAEWEEGAGTAEERGDDEVEVDAARESDRLDRDDGASNTGAILLELFCWSDSSSDGVRTNPSPTYCWGWWCWCKSLERDCTSRVRRLW